MRTMNIEKEELLTISEASKEFPIRPHTTTVWRWVHRGINGTKLESIKIGGRRYTSKEAINRFISETSASQIEVVNLSSKAEKVQQAELELDKSGI
jgi:Protein of unknown function (DUF1580)/Helix-turn-helix domain